MNDFLTVAEVATELRVSKMTVYRMVHDGVLESVNINKRSFRIRRADLDSYLRKQTSVR